MLLKTGKVIKKYWKPFTICVVCMTATYIVTRRITLRSLPAEGISIDFFDEPTKDLVEIAIPKEINGVASTVFNSSRIGYFSQQNAARAFGVSETTLSKHLNGDIRVPHIQDETFQRARFRIFAEVEK